MKENNKKQEKTENEPRTTIIMKYKKLLKDQQKLAEFKEPVVMLLRRNFKAEWYEGIKQNRFAFKHTDGLERVIYLDPNKVQTITYADKPFKCYVCHEDHLLPLPEDPIATLEQFETILDKTLTDLKNMRVKELKAKGDLIWKVIIGIAILGGVYILYKMLVPADPTAETIIVQAANTTPQIINPAVLG